VPSKEKATKRTRKKIREFLAGDEFVSGVKELLSVCEWLTNGSVLKSRWRLHGSVLLGVEEKEEGEERERETTREKEEEK